MLILHSMLNGLGQHITFIGADVNACSGSGEAQLDGLLQVYKLHQAVLSALCLLLCTWQTITAVY